MDKKFESLSCGFVSAFTKIFLVQPFDFVRYRIQTTVDKQANLRTIIKSVVKNESLTVVFKGFSVTSTSVFLMAMTQFSVFSFFTEHLRRPILRDMEAFNSPLECSTRESLSKIHRFYVLYAVTGLISGSVLAIVSSPLDNIRIRLQSLENFNDRKYKVNTPREAIVDLYRKNGVRGFLIAFHLSVMREGLASTMYFSLFNWLKFRWIIEKKQENLPILNSFIFGGLSGISAWTATLPIDTIKTKIISRTLLDNKTLTIRKCLQEMKNTKGYMTLYQGWTFLLVRAFVVNGFVLTAFDRCKRHFKNK